LLSLHILISYKFYSVHVSFQSTSKLNAFLSFLSPARRQCTSEPLLSFLFCSYGNFVPSKFYCPFREIGLSVFRVLIIRTSVSSILRLVILSLPLWFKNGHSAMLKWFYYILSWILWYSAVGWSIIICGLSTIFYHGGSDTA